ERPVCLQDRTDDEAVKLRRLEASRGSSPRNASVGARGTFGGLSPLHVRSERSPLHDVRQHAHANGARTRRIACANMFSRTSTSVGAPSLKLWRATFVARRLAWSAEAVFAAEHVVAKGTRTEE